MTQRTHTLHLGECDLVISEDFQTIVSDFNKDFASYRHYFSEKSGKNTHTDDDKLHADLTTLFIK